MLADPPRRRFGLSRPWLGVLLLLCAAALAHTGRCFMIQDWLRPADPGPPPQLDQPPSAVRDSKAADGLVAPRLRVLLLDGLSLPVARELPILSRWCGEGVDLVVDVGFPTVSLPVQSVLWTGQTQQQSGLRYVVERLESVPPGSLPAAIADSTAVVESHREIADSFGFSAVSAGPPEPTDAWRQEDFAENAERAIVEDGRLVFVHVLRVDEAGHRHGAASAAYREAAESADRLLGRFVAAERTRRDSTLWVVLSDHGHRPGGGHGGAEDGIRLARACIFGGSGSWQAWPSTGRIHLIDLARTLFDALNVAPPVGAVGRPLGFAIAHPDPGATVPRPGPWRWLMALGLIGVGVVAAWGAARRILWLPWWLILGWGAVVWVYGPITLSNPVVYPPLGRDMLLGSLPAGLLCTGTAWFMVKSAGLLRTAIAQLGLAAAVVLASIVLSWGGVVPLWSAHASLFLVLWVQGAIAIAVAYGFRLGAYRRGRHQPSRSDPR